MPTAEKQTRIPTIPERSLKRLQNILSRTEYINDKVARIRSFYFGSDINPPREQCETVKQSGYFSALFEIVSDIERELEETEDSLSELVENI